MSEAYFDSHEYQGFVPDLPVGKGPSQPQHLDEGYGGLTSDSVEPRGVGDRIVDDALPGQSGATEEEPPTA